MFLDYCSMYNGIHNITLMKNLKSIFFLRGVQEESMEALDLMARRDVTQRTWDEIKEIC